MMSSALFERVLKGRGTKFRDIVLDQQGSEFFANVNEVTYVNNSHTPEDGPESSRQPPLHSTFNVGSASESSDQSGDPLSKDSSQHMSILDSKLEQFVARKADILFRQHTSPKENVQKEEEKQKLHVSEAEKSDYFAILPPLEQFMKIPSKYRKKHLFGVLQAGDIVIGKVKSVKDFGMFLQLLCVCGEYSRYIEDCDVIALLPAADIGDRFSQKVQLDDFRADDIVRGMVSKVDPKEEKVIISLKNGTDVRDDKILGLLSDDELPVHYRRSLIQEESDETYNDLLIDTLGFDNPSSVELLTKELKLIENDPPTSMRALQRTNFKDSDFSHKLRKKQSELWAMESVAKGVNFFKNGQYTEALQCFNRALEIDVDNVEAFVARGALYANRGNLSKALQDFGEALRSYLSLLGNN
ncbi:putative filaggrin [Apostichopus japonicus]|uniref:Putative filaggrin n=1 Tax=Stichopus japonicus TaxID=307972 RepID=A0A2G8LBV2_STIJA|nr:putative filaggrin [Apostichopus japonicus]